jgi:ribonucleoside-diphosphate reductase alpha chain
MPEKIKSLVAENGIRNCAILTQAPTGTVSILSGNCSAGIEPMFAPAYERRYWEGETRKTQLVFHPLFAQFMSEGKNVEHFIGAHDLTMRDHLEVQKIVQRHIDNAVSKTINILAETPLEEMEKVWLEYLPFLKGTTFYRETTRGYVSPDGTVELPPLSPISLADAKAKFVKDEYKVEAEGFVDCVSGSCVV